MPMLELGLRKDAHEVELIEPNGTNRPVLGTRHPEDTARRVKVAKQWNAAGEGPRHQSLAAIEEPLVQHQQTILSYQVSTAVAARLNGALSSARDSR